MHTPTDWLSSVTSLESAVQSQDILPHIQIEDTDHLSCCTESTEDTLMASTEQIFKIKIVNIGSIVKAELQDCIIAENSWILNSMLTVKNIYEAHTTKGPYINAILDCDEYLHQSLITARHVFINGTNHKCMCYDMEKVIQCLRCLRFGHIASNCEYDTACKKCCGNHLHRDCCAPRQPPHCLNCIRSNQHGSH